MTAFHFKKKIGYRKMFNFTDDDGRKEMSKKVEVGGWKVE